MALEKAHKVIRPNKKNKEIEKVIGMLERIPWSHEILRVAGTKGINDLLKIIMGG